ncbi:MULTISPECIES: molybdenum cofactor guanylyltransferase [unclassified Paenibacillus]|uniref:molybdenum cofactor guanylyltransferase n=1 Tax=unclassified Paenibacillus TaxID=185978 RepID=UPI001AE4C1EA|nr:MULTISPECIES: molybdenum cofactor guanylyltransferase [unclassified Paenibacillus]MBP1153720.1 molybdopterin-guanine dinucleotide biosynthesis protein A [Paenibacillus sp. PvP091]MBP1170895.1 molybdopterin-guanine dinucleotide biosynthesis protein A [Paenibacillus sp. PvR098]MBP2441923.1 molybdopterin-guanine dinucleotide biosynthesis protein A [Paenibacillus sp. PvP052]
MLTGLILAGGPNTRMNGDPKALLPFGGGALIERQIQIMREICQEVIVVTRDPAPLLRLLNKEVRIITDYFFGKGPLAGMHAGFSLAKHGQIWVVGCEMPFPSIKAAELLLESIENGYDAALPYMNGSLYPLHAVYDKACAGPIADLLEKEEARLSELLKSLRWRGIPESDFVDKGIDSRFIVSIDTCEDYQQALQCEKLQT